MHNLKHILEEAETIAVVGCSDRPARTSYAIARYLQSQGYRIIPVNPHIDACHGEEAYPDLQSLPEGLLIDIVNIFRNPRYTAEMVEMTIAYADETGTKPVLWTQLGVSSKQAEHLAEEAGLPYVKNRCIKVEHARLRGPSM